MNKRMQPTPAQRSVLEMMQSGATLARYEHPNGGDSWSLSNVPPINAGVKVRAQVAVAIRCAGWISADGAPVPLHGGKRQAWTLTPMGLEALKQMETA